jgi:hypothetical protein
MPRKSKALLHQIRERCHTEEPDPSSGAPVMREKLQCSEEFGPFPSPPIMREKFMLAPSSQSNTIDPSPGAPVMREK